MEPGHSTAASRGERGCVAYVRRIWIEYAMDRECPPVHRTMTGGRERVACAARSVDRGAYQHHDGLYGDVRAHSRRAVHETATGRVAIGTQ